MYCILRHATNSLSLCGQKGMQVRVGEVSSNTRTVEQRESVQGVCKGHFSKMIDRCQSDKICLFYFPQNAVCFIILSFSVHIIQGGLKVGTQYIVYCTPTFGPPCTFFINHAIKLKCPPWCGPDSSDGIATGYGLDGSGIESRWGRDFPHLSIPVLGPTQPPVQWVPGHSWG